MRIKSVVRAGIFSMVMLAMIVSVVSAEKPGPGTYIGAGCVFLPNPVAYLQGQSLAD